MFTSTTKTESNGGNEQYKMKPQSILVFTGDKESSADSYTNIVAFLKRLIPPNVYTMNRLTPNALYGHPWIDENCIALIVCNYNDINSIGWARIQQYCNRKNSHIWLLCDDRLLQDIRQTYTHNSVLLRALGPKVVPWVRSDEFSKFATRFSELANNNDEISHEFSFSSTESDKSLNWHLALTKHRSDPLLLSLKHDLDTTKIKALLSNGSAGDLKALTRDSSLVKMLASTEFLPMTATSPDESAMPEFTNGYLMCQKDSLIFNIPGLSYGKTFASDPELFFENTSRLQTKNVTLPAPNSTTFPIEVKQRKMKLLDYGFDSEKYFTQLQTKHVGRVLVFAPVCESTIPISKNLSSEFPESDGILVVAGVQIQGKGRGANQWLSPKGCALMTLNYNVALNSVLGQSIGIVQLLMAVAVVDAITGLVGIKNFPLNIKWPNDLYTGRDKKMGGVLVSAGSRGDVFYCTISCGLNVVNTKPIGCINDLLPDEKKLCLEDVFAAVMNKFEYHVNQFQKGNKEEFLRKYHQYWLHTKEEVSIMHQDTTSIEKVIIQGVDEFGYLQVRSKDSGRVFSVHDDGNSFDMMKGLIHPKKYT